MKGLFLIAAGSLAALSAAQIGGTSHTSVYGNMVWNGKSGTYSKSGTHNSDGEVNLGQTLDTEFVQSQARAAFGDVGVEDHIYKYGSSDASTILRADASASTTAFDVSFDGTYDSNPSASINLRLDGSNSGHANVGITVTNDTTHDSKSNFFFDGFASENALFPGLFFLPASPPGTKLAETTAKFAIDPKVYNHFTIAISCYNVSVGAGGTVDQANKYYDTLTFQQGVDAFNLQAGQTVNSNYFEIHNNRYTPTPEPATLAVLGIGALALRRRRSPKD